MTFLGVVVLGISETLLNLADFGMDPFTCMNMSVSKHLPISFGTWQLFVNLILFVGLLVFMKKEGKPVTCILGFGTIWNMAGVGFLIDFFTKIFYFYFETAGGMFARSCFFGMGIVGVCLGVSLYVTPSLGSAPYDALGMQMHETSKLSYKVCRIATDIFCVAVALFFGGKVGIGTLITALGTGALVQFFNEHVSEPFLNGRKRKSYVCEKSQIL